MLTLGREDEVETGREDPAVLDEEAGEPGPEPEPARPDGEPDQPVGERLERIQAAVDALREQFSEKIAVDAHKDALFDEMHQELIRHQNGMLDKLLEAMALDVIQLADSTKRSLCAYEEKEASEDGYRRLLGVVKGILEDLGDILYRQSIEAYQVEGDRVDVRRQKIVQTVRTDEQAKDNLVAARLADGYERGGKIVRPERIAIYKYVQAPGEDEGT